MPSVALQSLLRTAGTPEADCSRPISPALATHLLTLRFSVNSVFSVALSARPLDAARLLAIGSQSWRATGLADAFFIHAALNRS